MDETTKAVLNKVWYYNAQTDLLKGLIELEELIVYWPNHYLASIAIKIVPTIYRLQRELEKNEEENVAWEESRDMMSEEMGPLLKQMNLGLN